MKRIKIALFKGRADKIANMICPHLPNTGNVLDFGCGDMLIADSIGKKKDVKIKGIDVINTNMTSLPMKIYDGNKIPFRNKSFDYTYVAFVLHHTNKIESLVKECIRVTKKRVIILEDVYESKLDLFITKVLDYLPNRFLASKDMNIPFNFKRENEWIDLFKNLKVGDVKSKKVYPRILNITKHRIFILDLV